MVLSIQCPQESGESQTIVPMNPWALAWLHHARRTPFPSLPQDVRTILAAEESGPWVCFETVTEQLLLMRVHPASSLVSKTSCLYLFWAAGSGASICSGQLAQRPLIWPQLPFTWSWSRTWAPSWMKSEVTWYHQAAKCISACPWWVLLPRTWAGSCLCYSKSQPGWSMFWPSRCGLQPCGRTLN